MWKQAEILTAAFSLCVPKNTSFGISRFTTSQIRMPMNFILRRPNSRGRCLCICGYLLWNPQITWRLLRKTEVNNVYLPIFPNVTVVSVIHQRCDCGTVSVTLHRSAISFCRQKSTKWIPSMVNEEGPVLHICSKLHGNVDINSSIYRTSFFVISNSFSFGLFHWSMLQCIYNKWEYT